MAGVKISNLPAIVTPALTDVFPVVQAGVTYKETITQLGTLLVPIAGGTMTGALILNTSSPSTALQAASKGYVDSVATGLNIQQSCRLATTTALTVSYNNGASGVGATLTNAGAMAALSIDGVAAAVSDRILVKNQASSLQNGIYTVTDIGSGATNWVMTRATDFDTPTEIQPGDFVLVLSGTSNAQTQWVQTATVAAVGVDAITWDQFGADINGLILSIQNSSYVYGNDTGAANAYVATPSPALTAYVAGQILFLKITNTNTGASTVNVNGLGVKNIKLQNGQDPNAGAILAGMIAILQYDGTNYQLLNPVNFVRIATQVFTANGTYTPTSGMRFCRVRLVGGGGGGGGIASNNAAASGGGGAGGYAEEQYAAATIGASQAVTIGAAGTGGAAGANPGNNGGNSTFGALLTANGGTGGAAGAGGAVSDGSPGGAGGAGSGGDLNITGSAGRAGWSYSDANTLGQGGSGGSNPLGMGGAGGSYSTAGGLEAATNATGYGGGGAGTSNLTTATAGSDGTAGVCIVEEYA